MAIGSASYGGGNAGPPLDFSPIFQGMAILGQRREQERVRQVQELNKLVNPLIERWGVQGIAKMAEMGVPFASEWAENNGIDLRKIGEMPWNKDQEAQFMIDAASWGIGGGEDAPQQEGQATDQQVSPTPGQATAPSQPTVSQPINVPSIQRRDTPPVPGQPVQPVSLASQGPAAIPREVHDILNKYAEYVASTTENWEQLPQGERDRAIIRHIIENPNRGEGTLQGGVLKSDQEVVGQWVERTNERMSRDAMRQGGLTSSLAGTLPSVQQGQPGEFRMVVPEGGDTEAVTELFRDALANEREEGENTSQFVNRLLREHFGVTTLPDRTQPIVTGKEDDPKTTGVDESQFRSGLPLLGTDQARQFAQQVGSKLGMPDMSPTEAMMFRQTLIGRLNEGSKVPLLDEKGQVNWLEEAAQPGFIPGYGLVETLQGLVTEEVYNTNPEVQRYLKDLEALRPATQEDEGQAEAPSSPPALSSPIEKRAGAPLTAREKSAYLRVERHMQEFANTPGPRGMPSMREGIERVRQEERNTRQEYGYSSMQRRLEQEANAYVSQLSEFINRNPDQAALIFPKHTARLTAGRQARADAARSEATARVLEAEARKYEEGTPENELYKRTLDMQFEELAVKMEQLGFEREQIAYSREMLGTLMEVRKLQAEFELLQAQYKFTHFDEMQAAAATDARLKRFIEVSKLNQDTAKVLFDALEQTEEMSYGEATAFTPVFNAFALSLGSPVRLSVEDMGWIGQLFGRNPNFQLSIDGETMSPEDLLRLNELGGGNRGGANSPPPTEDQVRTGADRYFGE